MNGPHRQPLRLAPSPRLSSWWAVAAVMALPLPISAAEIRGTVSVQHGGLFGEHGAAPKDVLVSVAVFPAEGQALPSAAVREQDMVAAAGSGIQPLYVALPRGSRLRFRNGDDVHHQLFSHSHTQPLAVHLDGSGQGSSAIVVLRDSGDLHWFCRIHAKSYARVDVVDTPLVRTLRAGESFEFRDLAPGKWRLRVAAPGAEAVTLVTEAVTAPPPLRIPLAIKGLMPDAQASPLPHAVAVEQLFPSRPGL